MNETAETAQKMPESAAELKDSVVNWFSSIDTSTVVHYIVSVAGALVLLLIGFFLAKQFKKLAIKAVKKGMKEGGETSPLPGFLGSGVYYLVILVVVLACLSIFGIETTSLAAVIGAAGLAIGLAFQGTLSNLAAGVMLIVFHPFKLGDFITGGGQSGVVKAISLFTTTIVTLDNRTITLPNSALSGSTIDNCSTEKYRRADVSISVPYEADLDSIRAALERAMNVEGALEECECGKSHVYLLDLAPGGKANYQIRVWCEGADYWAVRERVTAQAKRELDRNGVAITSHGLRRADVNVSVPYSADLDSVRAALERAMNVEGALLESDAGNSHVYLLDVEPGGKANYQIRVWCEGVNYWAVRERVTAQAKRELDRNGVSITSKGLRRADVNVGVAYEADLDATRKALEAACKIEGVLNDPAPAVVLLDLGSSSVNYQVRCWCEGDQFWSVKERLTVQVKRELDKAHIEIPFPQVTVSNKK